jgi:hypothetical protein
MLQACRDVPAPDLTSRARLHSRLSARLDPQGGLDFLIRIRSIDPHHPAAFSLESVAECAADEAGCPSYRGNSLALALLLDCALISGIRR